MFHQDTTTNLTQDNGNGGGRKPPPLLTMSQELALHSLRGSIIGFEKSTLVLVDELVDSIKNCELLNSLGDTWWQRMRGRLGLAPSGQAEWQVDGEARQRVDTKLLGAALSHSRVERSKQEAIEAFPVGSAHADYGRNLVEAVGERANSIHALMTEAREVLQQLALTSDRQSMHELREKLTHAKSQLNRK